jgi:hypothetical protein
MIHCGLQKEGSLREISKGCCSPDKQQRKQREFCDETVDLTEICKNLSNLITIRKKYTFSQLHSNTSLHAAYRVITHTQSQLDLNHVHVKIRRVNLGLLCHCQRASIYDIFIISGQQSGLRPWRWSGRPPVLTP